MLAELSFDSRLFVWSMRATHAAEITHSVKSGYCWVVKQTLSQRSEVKYNASILEQTESHAGRREGDIGKSKWKSRTLTRDKS